MKNTTDNSFKFYKSFITCPDDTVKMDITTFSQKEADNLYKNKLLKVDNNMCKPVPRIYLDRDKDYLDFYCQYYDINSTAISDYNIKFHASQCVFNNLGVDIYSQKICKIQEEWPFDSMFLINDEFLITVQDGWYFVFKRTHAKTKVKEKNDTYNKSDNIIPDDFFVQE